LQPFDPLFKNPHLATLAGNFWRRPESETHWPVKSVVYQTEPGVRVLVHTQVPDGVARGELILVHGLEGSSNSGYNRSMAYAALQAGYVTHRFNMRSCGGTESLAPTNYHSGQTSDLLYVIRERKRASGLPVYLIGYSLGGNVALKLAGELGGAARELLTGVCAVSTPIDLAKCVAELDRPQQGIYQRRFMKGLKARIRLRHQQAPEMYTLEYLPKTNSVYEFDDYYTARLFGFGTADNYYRTQSSNQFLEKIRVSTLLVQAKDDPLVPFGLYDHPAFARNPHLKLVAVEYGGHLGFLARHPPRFWLDELLVGWIKEIGNKPAASFVS